jgi:Zn-finger nucleic acid-binding protein
MLDVSRVAVGERVRCGCGSVSSVSPPAPIAVRTLTCRHCGGAFQSGAVECPWCQAGIAMEDRNLAGLCGRCMARMTNDARYCPGCGIEVRDQSVVALAESAACPRCAAGLRTRALEEAQIVECTSCGGLWLTPEQLESLCARAEDGGALRRALDAAPPPARPVEETKVRYLPCATCTQLMMRKNFGGSSGVLIDVCRNHGVWLDHRELARALDFVQRGGLERERERRARAERDRKAQLTTLVPGAPSGGASDPFDDSPADVMLDVLLGGLARLAGKIGRF